LDAQLLSKASAAFYTIGAMIAALLIVEPARAAEAEQSLDVVFVSGQRRREDVQDVPIAIKSLSGAELSARQVRTLEDLNGLIPGFVTTNTVSYGAAPLSIRGVGGANGGGNFFNDEPVAVYIDGVYVSRLSVSTADLIDIDSIEVLRGPQGTLYGRNSTAGAVLISTRRPTDETEGALRVGGSSIGDYRVSGFLSGALSDALSARASFGYSNRDGYGRNIVNGEKAGGGEDASARLSLRYRPRDSIRIDLIGDYQNRKANPALLAVTSVGQNGTASPFALRADFQDVLKARQFEFDDVNSTASDTWSLTTHADIDLGFATLNLISGWRNWSLDGEQDSDSTGLQLFTNRGAIRARQVSQEIRLSSSGDRALTWLVGGLFLYDKTDVEFAIQNFQGLSGLGTDALFNAAQKNTAYAVFADATYDLTDRIALTAGVRYSQETKDFSNDLLISILNGGTAPPSFLGGATFAAGDIFSDPPVFSDRTSFNDVSPRAVVEFKPDDNTLLYASYSQGFKSGGFNSFGLTPAFDSENIHAYEIGVKSELADRRIRLNASFFMYDYTNLQIRLPVPTGGVDIRNVAASKIKGFEIEGTASPFAGFTVAGSLALLDAEITQGMIPAIASDTPPFPIGAPLPLITENVSGNRLTRAPEFQAFATAEYEREFGSLTASLSATYRRQSSVFFLETNQNTPTFRNRGWQEIDLSATISKQDSHWELALYAQNLTDNRHITAVTALGGFPNASIIAPRRWGVEGTLRF